MNNNDTQPANFRRVLLLSLAIVVVMLLISAYAWQQLPAGSQIPVHWGVDGQPDRYGGKFEGLMLTPLIGIGLAALLAVLPRIDPRGQNLRLSARAYNIIWGAIMLMLLAIHAVVVLNVLGYGVDVSRYVPLGVGLLFIVLGNFLGKVRSNWFIGIRTPWTLSSELSWNKTHRLGGRLFFLLGLLFVLTAFLPTSELWVWLLLIGALGSAVVMFAYSYFVWRSDPKAKKLF